MSRTAKTKPNKTKEWQSKRPCKLKNGGVVPGPDEKKVTHRAERRQAKQATKDTE